MREYSLEDISEILQNIKNIKFGGSNELSFYSLYDDEDILLFYRFGVYINRTEIIDFDRALRMFYLTSHRHFLVTPEDMDLLRIMLEGTDKNIDDGLIYPRLQIIRDKIRLIFLNTQLCN